MPRPRPQPKTPSQAHAMLRQASLRATPRRVEVLEFLLREKSPRALPEIHNKLRGDKITLYRTLNTLVAANLAHRVSTDHRTWLFAAGLSPHHSVHPHTVCRRCGSVRCVPDSFELQELVPMMKIPANFAVRACDVVVHGICGQCRRE